jgi:replication factor C small subunit
MNSTHSIWVERYRPDTLEGYIGNDSLKSKIGKMIATGDVPHLLLSGPAGTGKTTVAKIIVKNIECDYLYINASDENNVDTVRNKIKSFASTMGFKPLKVIILDEADYLTQNAQAALRNIMETFSRSCRFILTCNYVERMIDPIISRTQQFHVVPPSKVDVAKHLVGILKKEEVSYQAADVKLLVDAHYPDIRKVIGEAQSNTMNSALTLDAEEIVAGDVKLKVVELLNQKGDAKKRFVEIRQLIADAGIRDFADMYTLLYEKVDEYAKGHVSQVILHIAEGQKFDGQVVNKEINMMATLVNILQTIG